MKFYCCTVFTVDYDKLRRHILIIKEATEIFFKGITEKFSREKN